LTDRRTISDRLVDGIRRSNAYHRLYPAEKEVFIALCHSVAEELVLLHDDILEKLDEEDTTVGNP